MPYSGINPKSIVNNHKIPKMKKFFAIAIIAASFAACNNSGESKSTDDTAAVKPVDTASMTPADTASKMSDTTSKMSADTSKMKADTSKKK